jgi:hypothetical protein
MSLPPEQVQPPAGHTVLFRSSPARTFAAMVVILAVSYLIVSPLVNRMLGDAGDPWWSTLLQAVVLATLVAGALAFTARASLRTWIRVSDGGLEVAAQGSDPIWLTWADIANVVVRRTGVRTVLEVTPVDLDSVHHVQGDGPGWPTMTETGVGTAFTADLTQLWPGPRSLRRELARRMPANRAG